MNSTTFYNELSSFARHIPKINVQIIGGDMNTQIGKNVNNKFGFYKISNRNGEYSTDFSSKSIFHAWTLNSKKVWINYGLHLPKSRYGLHLPKNR